MAQTVPELIFKPPQAAWIDPPPVPQTIADDAQIAVFADWGTGLYGAPAIAQTIVLHLGDTYYSGEESEIHDRLVGDWPKRPAGTLNRSLNGNHEMSPVEPAISRLWPISSSSPPVASPYRIRTGFWSV